MHDYSTQPLKALMHIGICIFHGSTTPYWQDAQEFTLRCDEFQNPRWLLSYRAFEPFMECIILMIDYEAQIAWHYRRWQLKIRYNLDTFQVLLYQLIFTPPQLSHVVICWASQHPEN